MKEDRREPMDDRDDIARLVRLAGKRQAVPQERTDRVKAAARAQWQGEVQRRSRKRYAWAAAGLAAAASLVLAFALGIVPLGPDAPTGRTMTLVEALTGSVTAAEGGTLEVGSELRPGSELVTAESSRAAIRLASGHSVRLDASSHIRLLDDGSLALDRGALYVDSGPDTNPTALVVHTPRGVIEEIGTQFEVRLDDDDSVRVRLREGKVIVHEEDADHELQVGTELELGADGSVTRRALATHGPEWDWIVGVTPMLDLEGETAMAFLEWAARERGWKLAFADESVARSASEIVLGGTLERVTVDQALDAVLPTCNLTHRVEQGVLLIASAPAAS